MSKSPVTTAFNLSTTLSLREAMILLCNIYRAKQDAEIGFEHAVKTIEELCAPLEAHKVELTVTDIESALWSCQLLDEKGEFWHPFGRSFDEFLKDISEEKFNKFYCWFERYGKTGNFGIDN